MSSFRHIQLRLIALAGGVIAIDQGIKSMVARDIGNSQPRHERWLFGDWLGLSYAQNSGVAFGWLRGHSTTLLALSTLVVLAAIGIYVYANRDSAGVLYAGALIAGGAIGNVIDRIRLGYVRDFFAIGPWPQFNVADAAITIGVGVALISSMRKETRSSAVTTVGRSTREANRAVLTDAAE